MAEHDYTRPAPAVRPILQRLQDGVRPPPTPAAVMGVTAPPSATILHFPTPWPSAVDLDRLIRDVEGLKPSAGAVTLPTVGRGVTMTVMPSDGVGVSPTPDRELIALCAEFDAAETAIRAIYDGPDAVLDDDAASAAVDAAEERLSSIIDRMGELRASTPAGIQARAHTLALHNRAGEFSFDDPDTFCGRLVGYLMRDAAALGSSGVVVTFAAQDGELLALCAKLHELNQEVDRLPLMSEAARNEAIDRNDRVWQATMAQAAALPATTLEGVQARAKALRPWIGEDIDSWSAGGDPPLRAMLVSLACDLLGGGVRA